MVQESIVEHSHLFFVFNSDLRGRLLYYQFSHYEHSHSSKSCGSVTGAKSCHIGESSNCSGYNVVKFEQHHCGQCTSSPHEARGQFVRPLFSSCSIKYK
jgi:hypothetical protein